MTDENLSIIEEINEEVKHDKQVEFFKKHKNIIIAIVVAIVVGIVMYSSVHERKQKQSEEITSALLGMLQNPSSEDDAILANILNDAPAELKPILTIIKSGKKMIVGNMASDTLQPLLDLSMRNGVNIIWKDLAVLIYSSYPTKLPKELLKMLEPLTSLDRPFRLTALELMGNINESVGNREEAIKNFELILNDSSSARTLKDRVNMYLSSMKNEKI